MQSQPPLLGRRPVAGFFFDLAIAVAALFALSLVAGIAWAMFELVRSVFANGAIPKPDELMRTLGQPDAVAMIWITLVSTGGAALLMYFWRRRASAVERAVSMQSARRPSTWGWVIAAAATTFLLSSAITVLAQHFDMKPQPTNLALIEEAYVSSPVFLAVFGVLIAPAYEELLFRRVLFGRLWAAGRPWLGVVLSSAAFAFMHEIPGTTDNSWQATGLLWITYGGMGAVFAGLYWRTRTLWAPITAHALNNAIALAALKLYGAG